MAVAVTGYGTVGESPSAQGDSLQVGMAVTRSMMSWGCPNILPKYHGIAHFPLLVLWEQVDVVHFIIVQDWFPVIHQLTSRRSALTRG